MATRWFGLLCLLLLLGCQKNQTHPTTKGARSSLDIFPVLQDERWAWGAGAPTLLLRGHFTRDKKEDVLIVAEPLVRKGMVSQHFFLLRGPALSPGALSTPKIEIAKGVASFRWDIKIRSVTSAHAADINGDGALDVVVSYRVGRVAIFYGDGEGKTFTLAHVLTSEGDGMLFGLRVALGDWNRDGKIDVMAMGSAPRLFLWQQVPGPRFLPKLVAYGKTRPGKKRIQKALKSWPPATSMPALTSPTPLVLPQWREGLALALAPQPKAAPTLLLVGRDGQGRTRLWWSANGTHRASHPLPASWPKSTPIRNAGLLLAPFQPKKPPQLFLVNYQFGMINQRGFGWMQQLPYVPQKSGAFPESKHLILWENALSFGLTHGAFGAQKEPGVVLFSPYRILAYAQDKRLFHYHLRRDPIVRKRLSLRAAVGCDLNGDGRDALVMLSVGALRKNERIGVQLLLLRKPLY